MKSTTFFTASALASVLLLFSTGLTAQAADDGDAIMPRHDSQRSGIPGWQKCAMEVDPSRDRVQYFPVQIREGTPERTGRQAADGKAWEVLLNETFEVQFPESNGWQTFNSIGFAPYYWGKSSYTAHGGVYSGWCCGAHRTGNPDLNPATDSYPDDMKAWMIWGPFDLSDASDAEMLFYYWLDTEEGYDVLGIMASTDGTQFYGSTTSGFSAGWVGQEELDLTDVYTLGDLTGDPNVWIAFIFTSDYVDGAVGVFLDDIMVRKEVADTPPAITHTPVSTAAEDTALNITATITDDGGSPTATLYYRRGGDAVFNMIAMVGAGDQFSGTIPAGMVTSRGLEYYLSATDGANTVFHPATDPTLAPHAVRVQVNNLVRAGTLSGGGEQTAYRMFSVPLGLDNAGVEAVLGDELGDYDDTRWRLFKFQNAAYNEHPSAGNFMPGQAFWLIVSQSVEDIDAGSGTTVTTADSFEVVLPPGWTDIGLPFDFPVSTRSLWMDTAAVNGPYAYQGQWMLPAQVPYLSPWHGYAFHNLTAGNVTLKIPPVMGMMAAENDAGAGVAAKEVPGRWAVRMLARCGEARDEHNYFGCSASASPHRDPLDLSEPPPVGSYVSLSAVHPDWPEGTGELAADFRPPNRDAEIWDLRVSSNCPGSIVRLTWELDAHVPPELEVRLRDMETGADLDLRAADHYQFLYRKERTFQLIAGPAKTVRRDAAELPRTCRLYQNHPNPFNPTTTIGFDLSSDTRMELVIYNVLGERVRTLCSGRLPAGSHQVELNAGDLAAGIYFCRLQAGSFSEARKMVLMR